MAEGLQKRFQNEIEKYRSVQKEYQKVVKIRQQLEAQLTENNLVKDELELLESDANVFKLIGPVLIKQDLIESKQNVQKRLDYIQAEIKRQGNLLNDLEKKQNDIKETIGKLQQQLQQAHVKAAIKS